MKIFPTILSGAATTNTNGSLQADGSAPTTRTAVNDTNYTALATDYLIAYTAITTGRTVTVNPAAAGSAAKPKYYLIKDESGSAGTNNLTVSPTSGTIDGAATKVISAAYGILRVYSNGTNFFQW